MERSSSAVRRPRKLSLWQRAMRFVRARWYVVPTILLLVVAPLAAPLVRFAIRFWTTGQRGPIPQPYPMWLWGSLLLVVGGVILWLFWVVVPFGRHEPPERGISPRDYYRTTRWLPWIPFAIVLGLYLIAGLLALYAFFQDWRSPWQGDPSLAWSAIFRDWPISSRHTLLLLAGLPTLVVFALVAIFIRRHFDREYPKAVWRHQICFECGYDLEGNPDAETCPECGTVIPEEAKKTGGRGDGK
ncbi:MAG: hypothetical protein ACLFV3_10455 [Phycisphaeraceae bacterium]